MFAGRKQQQNCWPRSVGMIASRRHRESSSSPSAITASNMVGCSSGRVVSSWWMVWWMVGCRCGQPILGRRSHCSSSWLQLTSTSVGKLKQFQNRSGTMCCKSCSLAQDIYQTHLVVAVLQNRQWVILWLWTTALSQDFLAFLHYSTSRWWWGNQVAGHAVQTIRRSCLTAKKAGSRSCNHSTVMAPKSFYLCCNLSISNLTR